MLKIVSAHLEDYNGFALMEKEVSTLHANSAPWNFRHTEGYSFTKEYFEELISKKDSLILLAKEESEIVGFAIAYPKQSDDIAILKLRKWMFLMSFGVKETHKRKGIGTLLLERLEKQTKEAGYDSIELSVWSFNEEAIQFYTNKGFMPFSIKMRKTL